MNSCSVERKYEELERQVTKLEKLDRHQAFDSKQEDDKEKKRRADLLNCTGGHVDLRDTIFNNFDSNNGRSCGFGAGYGGGDNGGGQYGGVCESDDEGKDEYNLCSIPPWARCWRAAKAQNGQPDYPGRVYTGTKIRIRHVKASGADMLVAPLELLQAVDSQVNQRHAADWSPKYHHHVPLKINTTTLSLSFFPKFGNRLLLGGTQLCSTLSAPGMRSPVTSWKAPPRRQALTTALRTPC